MNKQSSTIHTSLFQTIIQIFNSTIRQSREPVHNLQITIDMHEEQRGLVEAESLKCNISIAKKNQKKKYNM